MEKWRSVQIDAIIATSHTVVKAVNIRQNVGVRQRRAFGPTRRAASVDQG